MSKSGATVTEAMLVASGRFIGAATARNRMARIFICRCSFPLKPGLALLHESTPPFLVVLAARAALHRGTHARVVGSANRLGVLLVDGFRVGYGKRRIGR